MKKIIWLLSLVLLAMTCQMSVAAASKKPITLESGDLWAKAEACDTSLCWMENGSVNYDKVKIISISSSKPKFIKVVKDSDGYTFQSIRPLKPGKSKITLKYKYKGKKYTTSAVYTVRKYPNAVKAVYINGKKVKLKKKSYKYKLKNYKGSKVKVKVVTNKGWKISHIFKNDLNDSVRFKNNKTIKLKKEDSVDLAYSLNNKDGLYTGFHVYIEAAK